MNPKIGRPKVPASEAKSVLLGGRYPPPVAKELRKGAADSGRDISSLLRDAATAEIRTPPIWVKSKWKAEELDGKLVEFKLKAPTFWVEGVGKFLVRKNPKGEIAIDICVFKHQGPHQIAETRYYLFQATADKIEVNPNSEVAPFRLAG
jgi:hypothetical protein